MSFCFLSLIIPPLQITLNVTAGDGQLWESSKWEDEARKFLRQVSVDFIEQLGAGANLSISKNKNVSESEVQGRKSHSEDNANNRNSGDKPDKPNIEDHAAAHQAAEVANHQATKSSKGVSVTRLELWDKFRASPKDLYDCFLLAPKIQAYTRQSAEITPQVNQRFSLLQGI